MALDNQGYVWAWGKNKFGQLGNNTTTHSSMQVLVKKDETTYLTDIIYIDAGFEHSLAIDRQGRIWVYGRNTSGELGQGVTYFSQEYAKPM